MARIVRRNEVDTQDEVAKVFTDVFTLLEATNKVVTNLATADSRRPHLGKPVLIHEDGNFYLGVVSKHCDAGLFEVDFLDGDNGCYGIEDLASNWTETKGDTDA